MANHQRGIVVLGIVTVLQLGLGEATVAHTDGSGLQMLECTADAPDEAAATAMAESCGFPVEARSRRTEDTRVFVDPGGYRTAEVATQPQRVRRNDSSFVPVDTTLIVDDTGSVVPVASVLDLRLSGGGDRALAKVGIDGTSATLFWPAPLPVPVLEGNTARYNEVLPGVDLQARADVDGFSEVLIVKTRAAAVSPALTRLRFAMSTVGLVARPRPDGLSWMDAATGVVRFEAGAAAMWDSPNGGSDDVWSPQPGARIARMPVRLVDAALEVEPDPQLLADPTTALPIVIDPAVSRTNWSMINGLHTTTTYWSFDRADHMKVGWTTDDGGMEYRSIVDFNQSSFAGRHVLDAKLESYLLHSWNLVTNSCTTPTTNVHATAAFGASTTWANHISSWSSVLGAVANQNCADAPNVRTEWGSSALTSHVHANATANQPVVLGLAATGSTSAKGWKKFDENRTKLLVTFNSYPALPSSLSVAGKACAIGSNRPFVGSTTPTLRAVVDDPDNETDLVAKFTWERFSGGTWSALGSGQQTGLAKGATGQVTIGSGLVDRGLYRFKAQTLDPWVFGAQSGTDTSTPPETAWCEFEIDTAPPNAVPGVSSPVYFEFIPGIDEDFHGGVGRTADFTFTPNGIADVAGYLWGWADPPTTSVATATVGGSVTFGLTPPPPDPGFPTQPGLLQLFVRSVDRAGGQGPTRIYEMRVGPGIDPVGRWDMTDPTGSTSLVDSSGSGRDLTLTAGTAGVAGRLLSGPAQGAPTAVSFNGNTTQAASAAPVLDTSGSFTVSAWARLTNKTVHRAVVSQDGVRVSGFALEYLASPLDRWVVDMYSADVDGPTISRASSTVSPRQAAWTHLVAVYDDGAGQLRLYVDGVLAGSTAHISAWSAGGPLLVGRARYGVANNFFAGDIADVRVWDRVVPMQEIAPMAASQVGWWTLDGFGFDDSGWGRDLTATGGVTWGVGQLDGAVVLNGSSGVLSATGPSLRTNQSYTVTARVKLANTSSVYTVVSQDGNRVSGFWLGEFAGKWCVTTVASDTDGASATRACTVAAARANTWTHLAGVHDAATGQLRLYVNGQSQAMATYTSPWQAGNGLIVGRAKWNGSLVDFVNGSIDDVHVFAGALPASEISKLFESS